MQPHRDGPGIPAGKGESPTTVPATGKYTNCSRSHTDQYIASAGCQASKVGSIRVSDVLVAGEAWRNLGPPAKIRFGTTRIEARTIDDLDLPRHDRDILQTIFVRILALESRPADLGALTASTCVGSELAHHRVKKVVHRRLSFCYNDAKRVLGMTSQDRRVWGP